MRHPYEPILLKWPCFIYLFHSLIVFYSMSVLLDLFHQLIFFIWLTIWLCTYLYVSTYVPFRIHGLGYLHSNPHLVIIQPFQILLEGRGYINEKMWSHPFISIWGTVNPQLVVSMSHVVWCTFEGLFGTYGSKNVVTRKKKRKYVMPC
jgi:hypothetical protein